MSVNRVPDFVETPGDPGPHQYRAHNIPKSGPPLGRVLARGPGMPRLSAGEYFPLDGGLGLIVDIWLRAPTELELRQRACEPGDTVYELTLEHGTEELDR